MAYDPYGDPRRTVLEPDEILKPGEVPSGPRGGYGTQAIVWIVIAVVLVVGGAILIGTRDASSPQASIQSQHTNDAGG